MSAVRTPLISLGFAAALVGCAPGGSRPEAVCDAALKALVLALADSGRQLAEVALDPDTITLGDLQRLLGGPGARISTRATNEAHYVWLRGPAPEGSTWAKVAQERCIIDGPAKANLLFAHDPGLSAAFVVGGDSVSGASTPIQLSIAWPFQGRLRGLGIGDTVSAIAALSRQADARPNTEQSEGQIAVGGPWDASWLSKNGRITYLRFTDRRYVVVPMN